MNNPEIYIGTAGWSYEDWQNVFYPMSHSRDFSWLRYYSRYFNLVEVNASYYTYLNPNIVANWSTQIETDDFQFTYKLHMDFTHKKIYGEKEIDLVKHNLEILKEKEMLSGLLIQFPQSFHFNNENIDYLARLVEIFRDYERFIEIRHNSWKDKTAKTVTFCTIDQPNLSGSLGFHPAYGNDSAYFRFHGRNTDEWKKSFSNFGKKQTYKEKSERYNYLYSEKEIELFSDSIKQILNKVKKVIVVFNNHPNGKALANAFQIKENFKGDQHLNIPGTITKYFPNLKKN